MPEEDDPVRSGPARRARPRRAPRRRRPARSPRRARGPTEGDRRPAAVELHGRPRRVGGGVAAARRRRACRRDPGQMGCDRRQGRAVDPQVDPVVELEARLAAQVLDRACELAGVALGAKLGRQCRCRGRRPGRRRWATAVPGRGVAWISTSSGASVTPPSVTDPSSSNVDLAGRAAAMTAGIADPRRLPILGRSGLTRRSTSVGLVVDDDDRLDVDLVGDEPQQLVVDRAGRGRAARARPSRAAGAS